MEVVHYKNIDFTIDSNGKIGLSSIWHVIDGNENRLDDWENLSNRVKVWAGNIGDPYRIPTNDSKGYTTDANYEITDIKINSLNRFEYEVSYGGVDIASSEGVQVLGISTKVNSNNEVVKTGKWRVKTSASDAFMPAIGSVISWAGEPFLCSDVKNNPETDNTNIVTIEAKDMAILMIGNPSTSIDGFLQKVKSAKWRVSKDALDAWLPSIGDSTGTFDKSDYTNVEAWGDADYLITAIKVDPIGQLGYNVSLTARHISVRHINTSSKHDYVSLTSTGERNVNKTWSVKWQCTVDGKTDFEDLAGTDASIWTGVDNTIVGNVDIRPINNSEYEIIISVDERDNIIGSSIGGASSKSLSQKVSVSGGVTQYTITAFDCGRQYYDTTDNTFPINNPPLTDDGDKICIQIKVKDDTEESGYKTDIVPKYIYPTNLDGTSNVFYKEWNSTNEDCPFTTNEESLPHSFVHKNFLLTTVTIVKYARIPIGSYVSNIGNLEKVYNNKSVSELAGLNGNSDVSNWLLTSSNAQGVLDGEGSEWSEQTSVYMQCPTGYEWNESYKGWA